MGTPNFLFYMGMATRPRARRPALQCLARTALQHFWTNLLPRDAGPRMRIS